MLALLFRLRFWLMFHGLFCLWSAVQFSRTHGLIIIPSLIVLACIQLVEKDYGRVTRMRYSRSLRRLALHCLPLGTDRRQTANPAVKIKVFRIPVPEEGREVLTVWLQAISSRIRDSWTFIYYTLTHCFRSYYFIAIMLSRILTIVLAATLINFTTAFSGDGTWYRTGEGACGATSHDADQIVALSPSEYSNGASCWKRIKINANGKSVDATVVDLCPDCAAGSIDLSPGAFNQLASPDTGRIHVNWDFV